MVTQGAHHISGASTLPLVRMIGNDGPIIGVHGRVIIPPLPGIVESWVDQNLLLAGAVVGSALLGLLVGVIAGKRSASSFKRSQHLENQLRDTQLELDNYKKEVELHFSETADAFKSLNASYTTLHQKLAGGAMALCGDAAGPMLSAPGEQGETADANGKQSELPLEPPRDYAPKKSPDEKGMLTEDFGLHKSAQAENDAA